MPQKLNKAGKMQDYIPKGNGDPSGEYGTSKGTNKNFTASDKKKTEANVITENKSVVVGDKRKSLKEKMNENAKNYKEENYNGHAIMPDLLDGYTVDYEGDEVWFKTKDEAKAFIDKEFGKKDNKANVIDGDLTGKGNKDYTITKEKIKTRKGEYEYPVIDKMPSDWEILEGALTAPQGYVWIHNKKSFWDKNREQAIIKKELLKK